MPGLQDILHKLEEGTGSRFLKLGLLGLALVGLLLAYNLRCYRNLSTVEAMDAAQVGRNLAEGHGFSTSFVRPLSMHLVQQQSAEAAANGLAAAELKRGTAKIEGDHPDLANAPVYPTVLAGLFKVLPFSFTVAPKDSFWNLGQQFWWYGPDFMIALFNEALFLGVVGLTFLLARRLFESAVAWVTVLVMLGTEVFWQFATSGLSTTLLLLLFVALCWCLVLLEAAGRDPLRPARQLTLLAVATGVLLGLGMMTRYSFGWLLAPALLFVVLYSGPNRVAHALAVVAAFLLIASPWVVRNVRISGLPFGTATLAVLHDTAPEMTGTKLERSLTPNLRQVNIYQFSNKLKTGVETVLTEELPKCSGSWVGAFFLVGLLVAFVNPAPARMRYFLVGTLLVLGLVQALGRTYLATDSPVINTENLLVLVAPLLIMYGVSLFYILLERMALPFQELRIIVIGGFVAVCSLPMVLGFLPPRTLPWVYPTCYPPFTQTICSWMKPEEMMMSDVPWAVAWYGQRQCIWLTLNTDSEFNRVHDFQKPVRALYLTPKTIDGRFLGDLLEPGDSTWGRFVHNSVLRGEVPPDFPLRRMPPGIPLGQIFLSDRPRW